MDDAVFAFHLYEESVFSKIRLLLLGPGAFGQYSGVVLEQGAGQGEKLQHEGAGGLLHGVQCGRGVLRQMVE